MFKQIIIDFKNKYLLTRHNLKEIDKFLWYYGKKISNNYFKKKKNSA